MLEVTLQELDVLLEPPTVRVSVTVVTRVRECVVVRGVAGVWPGVFHGLERKSMSEYVHQLSPRS